MKRPWPQYTVSARKCIHRANISSSTSELMSPIATVQDLVGFYSKNCPRPTYMPTKGVTMESNFLYPEIAAAFE